MKISTHIAMSAMLLSTAAAHASLLVNGGFEDSGGAAVQGWGGYTYGAGYSSPLPGWAVGSGSVDIVPLLPWKPAKEGSNSLDLVGFEQGSISQSFATVMGASYTLSFSYSKNVAGSPDPATADVSLAGTGFTSWTQGLSVTNAMAGGPNAMLWTDFSTSFIGTGNAVTLTFAATNSASNGGVFIDAVAVVPEPEAYGLALAGVGVVAAGMRRRRAAGA